MNIDTTRTNRAQQQNKKGVQQGVALCLCCIRKQTMRNIASRTPKALKNIIQYHGDLKRYESYIHTKSPRENTPLR